MTTKPRTPARDAHTTPQHAGHAWARALLVSGLCAAAMCFVGAFSMTIGDADLSVRQVIDALLHGQSGADDAIASGIVRTIRAPRVVLALLVGSALAVSGVLLQAVMRNPLAAPNIVGITAGSGLAATIVFAAAGVSLAVYLPPLAFAGALAAGLLVYALSWQPGTGTTPVRLVLAGVAVTAILTALMTYVMILSNRAQDVATWMAGSLGDAHWQAVRLVVPYLLVGGVASLLLARALDLMQLGDDGARSLGTRVELVRFTAILLASILTGAAVSVAGLVGFIGLIVPHVTRMLVGPRHAPLIVTSAFAGALLLLVSDLAAKLTGNLAGLAQSTNPGLFAEPPVGVVTALLGGPYFLFLLYRVRAIG